MKARPAPLKIFIVISQVEKSLGFEWLAGGLDRNRFDFTFLLLNKGDSALEDYLKRRGFSVKRFTYRSPKDRFPCFIKLLFFFLRHRPDIVHVHLIEAGLTAIPAAFLACIPKRIYTRHHSTFHHVYHPSFVKVDRWINRLSTRLIAISSNVREVLMDKEGVSPEKITTIHHGFRMKEFSPRAKDERLIEKYNLPHKYPIIGVISRYQHLKGYQYIIPAFRLLLKDHPNAFLLISNARGDFSTEVRKLLSDLPEGSYLEIDFEPDIAALFSLFDLFIHVPIDKYCEAFGQTYVEALAIGIPSIFTLSGIAHDFIKDHVNAIVVPYCSLDAIYLAMLELIADPELRARLASHGREDVRALFDISKSIQLHHALYST